MDIKELEAIAALMKENELTKVELEEKGIKLTLERKSAPPAMPPMQSMQDFRAPVAAENKPSAPVQAEPKEDGNVIKSPTVGVYYASPSPESSPYVKVGDKVSKGDVVCIIEAMKLMNEITSEFDGEISKICVGNGQVVEYGQPLFIVK